MTREQKYAEQMRQLGIYQKVFEPELHTIAIMERDLQRLTKEWKAEGCPTVQAGGSGPKTSNKKLDAIMALRKEILAHKDALGLTPKGLRRIKGNYWETQYGEGEDPEPESAGAVEPSNVLEFVRAKYAG